MVRLERGGPPLAELSAEDRRRLLAQMLEAREIGPRPASYGQRALWFLNRLAPESSAYNCPFVARVSSQLDVDALRRTFQTIVNRHSSLRTTFMNQDGQVVRVIAAQAEVAFELIDGSSWTDGDIERHLSDVANEVFDLERGPLFRVRVVELGPSTHILSISTHHIVIDYWSLFIVLDEVDRIYPEEAAGRKGELPALARTFDDHVREQIAFVEGNEGSRVFEYWRAQLGEEPPRLELPTDRIRPKGGDFRGDVFVFEIDSEQTAHLRSLAKQMGSTLNSVLLTGFKVVLARYAGQSDISVGQPTTGRETMADSDVVGYYANTVAIRSDISDAPTFERMVSRTHEKVVEAMESGGYPFMLLVEKLKLARDTSRPPVVQAMFVLQQAQRAHAASRLMLGRVGATVRLGGLTLESMLAKIRGAQFDVEMMLAESEGSMSGCLIYRSDIFDESTVEGMVESYRSVLSHALRDPQRDVFSLPMVSRRRELQSETWNRNTWTDGDSGLFQARFARQVAKTPDATAVVFGDERRSYAWLGRQVDVLAARMVKLGLQKEQRVALVMDRSPWFLVGMLAVLEARGAFVPIDPRYPIARSEHVLQEADVRIVLTTGACRHLVGEWSVRVIEVDEESESSEEPVAFTHRDGVSKNDLAYVIYTSGSTGTPKGVMIEHGGMQNHLSAKVLDLSLESGDRVAQIASQCFDISIWQFLAPLLVGAEVYVYPDEVTRDPRCLLSRLDDDAVTIAELVPSMLREMLDIVETPGIEGPTLSRLRWLLVTGEALPPEVCRRWFRLYPRHPLMNAYGPTECSDDVTHAVLRDALPADKASVPIGRALINTTLHVLDARMMPVPVGVWGELYVGGAGVGRGYLQRPEETVRAFLADPSNPLERWYRTGDRVRWLRDGSLEYQGRLDHQVKIRGFRIELGEIEAVLAQHTEVSGAIVVARDDGFGGQKRLVAYVTPLARRPSIQQLKDFVRARLPQHMVPSAIVVLDVFPVTQAGKVDRHALPAPRAESLERSRNASSTLASDLEQAIAGLWSEYLGAVAIGREDNFFELGGHSLLMPRIQIGLAKLLERDVKLTDLFEHPTVASLAQHLSGAKQEQETTVADTKQSWRDEPIAVIGFAGRFPGAPDVETLWDNLRTGREGIRFFSRQETLAAGVPEELVSDPNYVRAFGVVEDAQAFDADYFGYSPKEASRMDPQHALMLECAEQTLQHAGYDSRRYAGRVGVFAGAAMPSFLMNSLASGADSDWVDDPLAMMLGHDKDYITTRVSYKLDLRGPSVCVQTACSTSLVAVHLACQSIREGECDMALAGGVSVGYPQNAGYLFREGHIASPDGHTRAFDAASKGTVGGNGLGMVLLKPLKSAISDGDAIHAVVLGSAINNDGQKKVSYTAPSLEYQTKVIREAHSRAGVEPSSIGYVEAHGTGTQMGDPIEVAALGRVFGNESAGRCAIGSIKSNLGHLNTAAGVAGFIKAVLCVRSGEIPPSLHYETPNPAIDFAATPFYVARELGSWPSTGVRRAGVSSFGIGGTNAHVVLEQPPILSGEQSSRRTYVLPLSARTPTALDALTGAFLKHLGDERWNESDLADLAYTAHVGRREHACRRVVVCDDSKSAVAALRAQQGLACPRPASPQSPQVAFLVPGQGAQYPGMAKLLYAQEPAFRAWIDRGCEMVSARFGLDLKPHLLAQEEQPAEAATELQNTAWAQPALFITSVALAELWKEWGVVPAAVLGHSIGEYVAAFLAGVFSYDDALGLVVARGRLMASVPPGGMMAVSLAESSILELLPEGCSLAAVNGSELCVISGPAESLDGLKARLEVAQVACRMLHTSHAFHSEMMAPILSAYRQELERVSLRVPELPFVSNVTGSWITQEEAVSVEYWVRHLRQPVRFDDGVRKLLDRGVTALLEVGPGRTLSTLVQHHIGNTSSVLVLQSLPGRADAARAPFQVAYALGRLWEHGCSIDWHGYHRHERRRRIPIPTYPFQRAELWPLVSRRARGLSLERSTDNSAQHALERLDNAEWLHAPVWKNRESDAGQPSSVGGNWLLLADTHGLAERLSQALRDAQADVTVVRLDVPQSCDLTTERGRWDFMNQYHANVRECLAKHSACTSVVDLGAVEPRSAGAVAGGEYYHFYRALGLARALATGAFQGSIVVVSSETYAVSGAEPRVPAHATIDGPLTALAQEHHGVSYRHIDIGVVDAACGGGTGVRDSRQWQGLAAELMRGPSAEPRVALRGGERWLPAFEVRKPGLDRLPARLRSGGVYLITGGMGFVGQHIAFALARAVGARLLLVSRHIEPKASARLVRALKDEGASDVATLAADVADVEALQLVVDEARRRWGALHGVVHAAGVTGAAERTSTTVCAITMAACEEQLRPKLLGVQALGRMLTELPLDFVLLTSSLAAVLGGPGFAAYAAANAYMDSFAHTRCAQDGTTQWLSVNWDAWATSADKTAAAAFGSELARFALTPKEGRAALLGALALPRASQVLVSTGDLNARYAKWVRNALAQPGNNGESQPSTLQPRPSLSRTYAAPTNEVEETIAQIWCELLGFDRIGIHDQFAELGGHSLLATQVVSRVRNVLGVELPISDFLERPTVAGLSLVVLERLSEGVAEGEMALMLTQLETLDEDKAEQRLLAVGELSHVSVERTGRGAG